MRQFDLHIHSNFSSDCRSTVEEIVRTARRKKLSGIAITDHNTIQGGLHGSKYTTNDFIVIVGAEYSSDAGHILGYFLKEEIDETSSAEKIIEDIHKQGGIAVLAHPYKYSSLLDTDMLGKFDGLEIFNARAEKTLWKGQNNRKAADLLNSTGRGFTGGSDSHFLYEIGRGIWECDCEVNEQDIRKSIMGGRGKARGMVTNPLVESGSQIVKTIGTGEFHKLFRIAARAIYTILVSCAAVFGKEDHEK